MNKLNYSLGFAKLRNIQRHGEFRILTELFPECIVSIREGDFMAKTKKDGTRKIHRSSITGRFVKSETVKKHPKTTTTETVRKPKKK
jgi:hypothetical protein